MAKQSEDKNVEFSLRDILNVLKKNFILMVVIVLMCGVLGGVYANLRKPYYIASEHVNYRANLITQSSTSGDTVSNINIMDIYLETVKDFCKQDVVLARANYYYREYSNWKIENKVESDTASTKKALQQYIANIESSDSYNKLVTTPITSITASNITISSTSGDQQEFCFTLTYKDESPLIAEEKVRILTLAFAREIQAPTADNSSNYFGGIDIILTDLGCYGYTTDMSETKIIIIFLLAGVVLALLVVYLKVLLDNTVKDKETVEKLTGVNLLAYINEQEVK